MRHYHHRTIQEVECQLLKELHKHLERLEKEGVRIGPIEPEGSVTYVRQFETVAMVDEHTVSLDRLDDYTINLIAKAIAKFLKYERHQSKDFNYIRMIMQTLPPQPTVYYGKNYIIQDDRVCFLIKIMYQSIIKMHNIQINVLYHYIKGDIPVT